MKERKERTNKEWRGRKNRRKTQEERMRGRVTWNKAFTILHKKCMYKYNVYYGEVEITEYK